MKRKSIIFVIGLIVIVVVGVVVYNLMGGLGKVIQAGIETYGSKITKANVSLNKVTVDLTDGSAALHGLTVGNPAGYKTDYLLKLDEISMTLDLKSVTKNPVVIKEIMIQKPSVIYELASGGSNVNTLLNNIKKYTGTESKKSSGGKERKLIIDNLYIKGGQVNLSASALNGKTVTTKLPDIHLKDIGKKEGGATPGEVAEKIMGQIQSGATTAIGSIKNLPGAVTGQLKNVGGTVKNSLNSAGDKLKGLFGK